MSILINQRIEFTDLVVDKSKELPEYTIVRDIDGNVIGNIKSFLICHERRNGTRCNKNGSQL